MSQLSLQIDHVGILAPAVEPICREFRALGFAIVGPAELTAIDQSGERVGLGQFSAHVMFGSDYIELTAVESPTPEHHLAHFLQPPWGLRLLLLGCNDIEQAHREYKADELHPEPIQTASRTVSHHNEREAKFRWFGFPTDEWPDVLVACVQHLTPALVFDGAASGHANGAKALARLYCRAGADSGHYAKIAEGGEHRIEFMPPDSAQDVLGFDTGYTTPFAGVGIGVDDIDSTTTFLRDSNIDVRAVENGVSVRLRCGVCLVFEQRADNK